MLKIVKIIKKKITQYVHTFFKGYVIWELTGKNKKITCFDIIMKKMAYLMINMFPPMNSGLGVLVYR